jgi:hypothetical protein
VNQRLERRRRDRHQRRHAGRLVAQDRAHHARGAFGVERLEAGHHFEQHRAEGKDVGARVDLAPVDLLGRHV